MVVLGGAAAVSYERGTPVGLVQELMERLAPPPSGWLSIPILTLTFWVRGTNPST